MAVQESTKILDEKIRAMAEDFDTKLGEAFNRAVEGFQGRVESLIERFGAPAVWRSHEALPDLDARRDSVRGLSTNGLWGRSVRGIVGC
jgi:hypothetical protein